MQAVRQHRKNIEVTKQTKHFMIFLRVLLIALTVRVRLMFIWFCLYQIFAIN